MGVDFMKNRYCTIEYHLGYENVDLCNLLNYFYNPPNLLPLTTIYSSSEPDDGLSVIGTVLAKINRHMHLSFMVICNALSDFNDINSIS